MRGPPSGNCGARLSIDAALLEMLACPACGGEVRPTATAEGLECTACGRIYPVHDGIPVLLIEESTPPRRDS